MAEDPRIAEARRTAFGLYEGVRTPHRSCGIALAETFGLSPAPYQAFRRGGITGEGPCGAIQAGLAILGQLLGDPDPTGAVTPGLRAAAEDYQRRWREALFDGQAEPDIVCNHLTAPHGDFAGEARRSFCTHLVSTVAGLVAEVALRHGAHIEVKPFPIDASQAGQIRS
ncbi:MAG: hypothetical protein ACYTEZ_13820 [Planctomycetota bacterium]